MILQVEIDGIEKQCKKKDTFLSADHILLLGRQLRSCHIFTNYQLLKLRS